MKNWSGGRQKQRRARNKSAREIALEVLYHVDTRKAFADLQLNRYLKRKELQPRDAALATEIVFGTVRWRMRLDWVLGVHVRDGLDSLNPWIRNILRMGVYQFYFLDRVPAHAIVDESVKLAKKFGNPGMAGLVNAVLRRILREGDSSNPEEKLDEPLEGMAVAYSHPEWLVSRWLERFGDEEVRQLLTANNEAPGISLRVHAGKTDRELLRSALSENHVETVAGEYSKLALRVQGNIVLKGISEFEIGHFFVQDESETLVVELLDPQPGETILDLCAAPGGKTCHIQEARGSEGHVIAVDVQAKRLSRIHENLERMELRNVSVVGADGIDVALAQKVDRVLVDAPCSGLGVLARRADARWRKTPESVRALLPLQQELLRAGAKHVKPGGVLVYSVCSFEPEEGIEQVKAFLAQDSSFILEDAGQWLPETVVSDGYLTMLPHRHGTDGAFAARLKKQ